MGNKEKCFKYFGEHKELSKKELINRVAKEFKITHMTAESYYYKWKGENLSSLDEVAEKAVEQIWGESEKKEEKDLCKAIKPLPVENVEKEKKPIVGTKKSDDKPVKNPEVKEKARRLKITEIKGVAMNYTIDQGKITMHKSQGDSGTIRAEELEDLILDLQELKEVVM
ncbi:hypothetical protein [Clostridium sp. BJN0013]|uniref:hypothetical protein n=1 Tax=Clostridium sp. BJN0013 TaxID=3236840 RepID=UPI0034C6C53B